MPKGFEPTWRVIIYMKKLKICLAIALLVSSISTAIILQKLYAADTDKGGATIKACQDKIAVEREAIILDHRKLQEAIKTGDKAKIEQVRQETSQDIKNRKAKIRDLYKEMPSAKSDFKNNQRRPVLGR